VAPSASVSDASRREPLPTHFFHTATPSGRGLCAATRSGTAALSGSCIDDDVPGRVKKCTADVDQLKNA